MRRYLPLHIRRNILGLIFAITLAGCNSGADHRKFDTYNFSTKSFDYDFVQDLTGEMTYDLANIPEELSSLFPTYYPFDTTPRGIVTLTFAGEGPNIRETGKIQEIKVETNAGTRLTLQQLSPESSKVVTVFTPKGDILTVNNAHPSTPNTAGPIGPGFFCPKLPQKPLHSGDTWEEESTISLGYGTLPLLMSNSFDIIQQENNKETGLLTSLHNGSITYLIDMEKLLAGKSRIPEEEKTFSDVKITATGSINIQRTCEIDLKKGILLNMSTTFISVQDWTTDTSNLSNPIGLLYDNVHAEISESITLQIR